MQKIKMLNEYKLVRLCAKLKVGDTERKAMRVLLNSSINWNKIVEISRDHKILPLLYYTLDKLGLLNGIPQTVLITLKNHYYSNLLRNLLFEKEIFIIIKRAGKEHVNIIPFKGFSLICAIYHNVGIRIISDVDILIRHPELQKLLNILTQLGYRRFSEGEDNLSPEESLHMAIFSKMLTPDLSLIIEIHGALSYSRPNKIRIPHLWERACKENSSGQEMLRLSPEDEFLSLVLHLRRHLRHITLKFIIDIAELVDAYADKLDWPYIIKIAKDNHILTAVYFSLYITEELTIVERCPEALDKFRPPPITRALLHSIINKDNFFTCKKWQGTFLRFLLFDKPMDFVIYLWRVSFWERFITKNFFRKTLPVTMKTSNKEKTRK